VQLPLINIHRGHLLQLRTNGQNQPQEGIKTTWFSPLCDVDAGEAIGLYTTLDWMANLQFDNVDFVLDYKKIDDSFRTCNDDVTMFGSIIFFCKQFL
jgi:hypothetical protein